MDVQALDFAVIVVPATGAAQSPSNASTTQPAAAPTAYGFFFVDRTYRGIL